MILEFLYLSAHVPYFVSCNDTIYCLFLLPLKIGMNIGPERAGEERGQGAVERGRES